MRHIFCTVFDTVLLETTYIQDRGVLTGTQSGLAVTPKAALLLWCQYMGHARFLICQICSLNVEVSVSKAQSRHTEGAQQACTLLGAGESTR